MGVQLIMIFNAKGRYGIMVLIMILCLAMAAYAFKDLREFKRRRTRIVNLMRSLE